MGYQKNTNDTKFYRAVRKYGVNNFSIEKLDDATSQEELDTKELMWINKLDTVVNGYNTKDTKGKCGGDTLSNHPNLVQISQKISKSKMGDKNPMRILGGLKGNKNGMYGRTGSNNPSAKKCVSINTENNLVEVFNTLKELQSHHNVTTLSMVSSRCSGKTKSNYKSYKFMYYEDYVESQSTIKRGTE